ncbi:MAG: dihydropteroate synthase [Dehalococcoidia bacterium]|nr:dihydropteroate synthase [Dehalococcoidia bacterium]
MATLPHIPIATLRLGEQDFVWGDRTYVMGVVNATPDSFSGDGVLPMIGDVQQAVDQALRMEDEGADIIDVGGESTRPASIYPDAKPIEAENEITRVVPVIEGLIRRLGIPISIDTRKAAVADAAFAAGASLVNDVSMLGDAEMPGMLANSGVPIIVSHIRQSGDDGDVVENVLSDLHRSIQELARAGVERSNIIVDPGIGFAKSGAQSMEMLRNIAALRAELVLPVLIGTSRKSFIGAVTGESVHDRRFGTAATVALAIQGGADIVRVHDVREMVSVVKMSDALTRHRRDGVPDA